MESLSATMPASLASRASFQRRAVRHMRRELGVSGGKSKCLNRQEFVVVGWTEPEGSRPHLGALLLGYYSDDGNLFYAGRVGTGITDKVLADLRRRLDPLARTIRLQNRPCRPSDTLTFGLSLHRSRVGITCFAAE